MPSDDIEWIESACATGMEALGYPFTSSKPKLAGMTAPTKFEFLMDRLCWYRWNWRRWRRGWMRWKIVLRVRLRYLLSVGWLWKFR